MQNIILLLLCLAIGIALRGLDVFPDNAHTTLNTLSSMLRFRR